MRVIILQSTWLSAKRRRELRAAVVASLEAEGHEVVDTIAIERAQENMEQQTLEEVWNALQKIAAADAVYCMDGWNTDLECRIVYEACLLLRKKLLNAGGCYQFTLEQVAPSLARKAFPGMDELKTLEDYEEFFTRLMKECCPNLFWEYMKERPVMQIVAAVIEEASETLRRAGKLRGRCEICGAALADGDYGIYREDIEVHDAASGERFYFGGRIHLRCMEHLDSPCPSHTRRKDYLSFEDLTSLVWLVPPCKRGHPIARRHLITAMRNCIAGMERGENS